MNERIKYLRKEVLHLSQKEFADQIDLSENFVWMIEKGARAPGVRTVADICRVFGVDRVWLETGVGVPMAQKGKREVLKAIFNDVLSGRPSEKNAFIESVALLPDEVYPVLVKSWIESAEEMKRILAEKE